MKILDAFDTKSAHFNTIKYAGYGYKELVNKLRPVVTDTKGNLFEDAILKIAKEEVFPKMKIKKFSKEDIDNFFYSIMY